MQISVILLISKNLNKCLIVLHSAPFWGCRIQRRPKSKTKRKRLYFTKLIKTKAPHEI